MFGLINLKRLILFLLIILCLCNQASATDWFVDIDNDGGTEDGTAWATAWGKLSDIVFGGGGVVAGDTVYISDGTYVDGISTSQDGTNWSSPITIKPGSAHPTLSSGHTGVVVISETDYYGLYLPGANYWIINGNDGNGNCHIKITNCADSGIQAGAYQKYYYCEISSNGDASLDCGITFNNNTDDTEVLVVDHCLIHDNYDDQVLLNGTNNNNFGRIVFSNNSIYNLNDDGIQCGTDGLDFYNNTMYGKVYTGGFGHPDGLQLQSNYYRIYNNIFHDIEGDPVSVVNSGYKWELSSSGTNEYYVELAAGGDPDVHYNPAEWSTQSVYINGSHVSSGTIGSLSVSEWAFGDNDSLGFNTLYVRLADESDPDTKADGYIDWVAVTSSYTRIGATTGSDSKEIYIYNNLAYSTKSKRDGNTVAGFTFGAASTSAIAVSNILFANNTMVGLLNNGFQLILGGVADTASNVLILNNLVSNCGRNSSYSFYVGTGALGSITVGSYGDGTDVEFDYNYFSVGAEGNISSQVGASTYTSGNYSTMVSENGVQDNDPGNTNPSLGVNYSLLFGSIGIDSGITLSGSFTTDIIGIDRPQGTAWDIGAYEWFLHYGGGSFSGGGNIR